MAKRARGIVATGADEAPARVSEAAVPDAVVEEVAAEVAALVRRAELRCAFEVGRLVAERFFGGDLSAWHRRGPKANSLARLAERLRARGVGGPAALHLCLGVYETLAPLGEDSTWNHLTRSHVRAVLALPAPARASLLREAEARTWTVEELQAAASATTSTHHGGRARVPAFVRAIAQAERLFAPDGPIFRDLHQAVVLDAATVECGV